MSYTIQIINCLAEFGPQSAREIADYTDIKLACVTATLHRMSRANGRRAKLVYVKRWAISGAEIKRTVKVYALGNRPDAKKPAYNQAEVWKRWWRKHRSKQAPESVFNRHKNLRGLA